MNILAIETSCDETAICYLEATPTETGIDFIIHKNITHSQIDVHKAFGGVFPALAKREHQINLPVILDQVMHGREIPDYICVTNGPGLEPALWCGIVFAKELGEKWNIPVIPVNHMEGHILSVITNTPYKGEPLTIEYFSVNHTLFQFPALALLISGGHTELVLIHALGDYKIIGKTRDDAVGEAYDKIARMMGLPYPGGPEVSRLADHFTPPSLDDSGHLPFAGEETAPKFPRPMLHTKDYDFSFSGLKTAVLYHIQNLTRLASQKSHNTSYPLRGEGHNLTLDEKISIAHEFQNAVTDVLIKKTIKAIEDFGIQTLIIAGGVSANTHIISTFKNTLAKDLPDTTLLSPTRELTGDNALMIALAGYFKIQKNPDAVYTDIKAEGTLSL